MKKFLVLFFMFFVTLNVLAAESIKVVRHNDDCENPNYGYLLIEKNANDDLYTIVGSEGGPRSVDIYLSEDDDYKDKDDNRYSVNGIKSMGDNAGIYGLNIHCDFQNGMVATDALSGLTNLKVLDLSRADNSESFKLVQIPSTIEYIVLGDNASSWSDSKAVSTLPSYYTGVQPYEQNNCYYNTKLNEKGEYEATLVGFGEYCYHYVYMDIPNNGDNGSFVFSGIDIDDEINKGYPDSLCVSFYIDDIEKINFNALKKAGVKYIGFSYYDNWKYMSEQELDGISVYQATESFKYEIENVPFEYKCMYSTKENTKIIVGLGEDFPKHGGVIADDNEYIDLEIASLGNNPQIESIKIDASIKSIYEGAYAEQTGLQAILYDNKTFSDNDLALNAPKNVSLYKEPEQTISSTGEVFSYSGTYDEVALTVNLDKVGENEILVIPSYYLVDGKYGVPVTSCEFKCNSELKKIKAIQISEDNLMGDITVLETVEVKYLDISKVNVKYNEHFKNISANVTSYVILSKKNYKSYKNSEYSGVKFDNISQSCNFISYYGGSVVEFDNDGIKNFAIYDELGYFPEGCTFTLIENVDLYSTYNSIGLKSGWTFDGRGHCITFDGATSPIFSKVESGATVKNLYVTGEVKVSDATMYYSPFVAENKGTITRCVVADMRVESTENTSVGFFAGTNNGTISESALYGNANLNLCVTDKGTVKECLVATEDDETSEYTFKIGEKSYDKSLEVLKSNLAVWTAEYENIVAKLRDYFSCPRESINHPTPIMNDFEMEYDTATKKVTFKVDEASEWEMAVNMITSYETYDIYKNATIKLTGDIVFDEEEIKTLFTSENVVDVYNWFDYTAIGSEHFPFLGTVDGQGHSMTNVVASSYDGGGVFGYLGEGAKVRNLNIVNSAILLQGSSTYYMSKSEDGKTAYAGILAYANKGKISDVSFVGDLYIDEQMVNILAKEGLTLEWTPVADKMPTTATISNMLFYIANLKELEATVSGGGNKRNIIIMQNLGVGRNAGQTQKVCNNSKGKKSLSAGVRADVNNSVREYTDAEMAEGEPAYWLNHDGVGYSDKYTKKWSIGKNYPILATSLMKPAVKIVYDIEGVTDDEAGLINPVFFANEDDEVEINVTNVPSKVWVGDGAKEMNSASRLTKKLLSSASQNGVVTIHLQYGSATDIDKSGDEIGGIEISANGQAIRIVNGEGQKYSIVDILGRTIAQGTVASQMKTVVVPSAGIYIVKAGDKTQKVIVR